IQRLSAIADHHQAVRDLRLGERKPGQLHVVRIVLDQQDVLLHHHGIPDPPPAVGSSSSTVAPPASVDSARSRPPWRAMTRCATARPRPCPAPSSGPCSRWKGSKILCE